VTLLTVQLVKQQDRENRSVQNALLKVRQKQLMLDMTGTGIHMFLYSFQKKAPDTHGIWRLSFRVGYASAAATAFSVFTR